MGLISMPPVTWMASVANVLTTLAMAALGLSVDLRAFVHTGGRVMFAAMCSIILLASKGFILIQIVGPA